MKFHKTLKGKLSGEDLLIRPTVLDKYDSESLVQIKPYFYRLEIAASLDAALHRNKKKVQEAVCNLLPSNNLTELFASNAANKQFAPGQITTIARI